MHRDSISVRRVFMVYGASFASGVTRACLIMFGNCWEMFAAFEGIIGMGLAFASVFLLSALEILLGVVNKKVLTEHSTFGRSFFSSLVISIVFAHYVIGEPESDFPNEKIAWIAGAWSLGIVACAFGEGDVTALVRELVIYASIYFWFRPVIVVMMLALLLMTRYSLDRTETNTRVDERRRFELVNWKRKPKQVDEIKIEGVQKSRGDYKAFDRSETGKDVDIYMFFMVISFLACARFLVLFFMDVDHLQSYLSSLVCFGISSYCLAMMKNRRKVVDIEVAPIPERVKTEGVEKAMSNRFVKGESKSVVSQKGSTVRHYQRIEDFQSATEISVKKNRMDDNIKSGFNRNDAELYRLTTLMKGFIRDNIIAKILELVNENRDKNKSKLPLFVSYMLEIEPPPHTYVKARLRALCDNMGQHNVDNVKGKPSDDDIVLRIFGVWISFFMSNEERDKKMFDLFKDTYIVDNDKVNIERQLKANDLRIVRFRSKFNVEWCYPAANVGTSLRADSASVADRTMRESFTGDDAVYMALTKFIKLARNTCYCIVGGSQVGWTEVFGERSIGSGL